MNSRPNLPHRRALLFAAGSSLLPAAALVGVGVVLLRVRESEAAANLEQQLDDAMDAAEEIVAGAVDDLRAEARRRMVADESGTADQAQSYRLDVPRSPEVAAVWRPVPGPPPTKPMLGHDELNAQVFVASIQRVQREHYAGGRFDAAVEAFGSMLEESRSIQGDARLLLARAGALQRAGRFEEALGDLEALRAQAPFEAELDGIPLTLSIRLQRLALLQEMGETGRAEEEARALYQDVATDDVPLPAGQVAAYLAEIQSGLGEQLPALEPVGAFARRSRIGEAEARAAKLGTSPSTRSRIVRDAGAQWVLEVEDVGVDRAEIVWRGVGELPSPRADMSLGVSGITAEDAGPFAVRREVDPGLGAAQLVVRAGPGLLAERVAPWRTAVWSGSAMVALMALLSAWLAARSVRRGMELAELRAQIATTISHELRTPLTAMLLELELLEDPRTEDRAGHGKRALRAGQRLSRLVDRVLQFSRVEHSGRTGPRERVAPGELVDATLEAMGEVTAERSVQVDVDAEAPVVEVDREAVVQVLCGLVENSLKYGGDSAVRVTAERDGSRLRIAVEDRGPGVSKEERSRLFEEFWRSPRHADRVAGSGLGLAIAKRLVEAQGGTIHAEATAHGEANEGLRVVIALPVPVEAGS